MAQTKYISLTNLQQALDQVKEKVVLKVSGKGLSTNDLTNELKQAYDQAVQKVAQLEATGGQANVLESVKVNGVALKIAEKAVDILIATGATNGTLSVNGADVVVKGLAALAYKAQVSEADLDAALTAVLAAKASKSTVDTLIGTDTGKSVRNIAAEELAAQLIPEDAADSLNTLQEIADWIQDHPDDAATMNTAITKLQAIAAGIGGAGDDYATVLAAIEGKIAAALASYSTTTQMNEAIATAKSEAIAAAGTATDTKLAAYVKTADLVPATTEEITAMFASWSVQ